MSIAEFSHDFGHEFASLYADIERPVPLIGQQIVLIPFDYVSAEPTLPIAFHNFNELRDNYQFTTFDELAEQVDYPDFDHIMQGHPGFPGGPRSNPPGTGLMLGYSHLGVEWWITDAEGIEGSAQWQGNVVSPAGVDGSWPVGVFAAGREIAINVTLLAEHPSELTDAKAVAAATLAVPPRRGWLIYRNRRISVQLDGPVRVRSKGSQSADLQVRLRGVDVGTPGAGVHFEDADGATTYNLTWGLSDYITLGGVLPSPPLIEIVGPTHAGIVVSIGGIGVEILDDVPMGSMLTIDSRSRRVLLDGVPRLSAVIFDEWPLMTVGVNQVLADPNSSFTPNGVVRVSATALY